jgi:hypothetical protein
MAKRSLVVGFRVHDRRCLVGKRLIKQSVTGKQNAPRSRKVRSKSLDLRCHKNTERLGYLNRYRGAGAVVSSCKVCAQLIYDFFTGFIIDKIEMRRIDKIGANVMRNALHRKLPINFGKGRSLDPKRLASFDVSHLKASLHDQRDHPHYALGAANLVEISLVE